MIKRLFNSKVRWSPIRVSRNDLKEMF